LSIPVVYCRPYKPEGKGKIERWHRVVRAQFVSELSARHLQDFAGLNAYLWAWIERDYHRREHSKLAGLSPLQRWQQDLTQVRSLGPYAATLDELFFHREPRKVRRDGTISFWGQFFEVPYELSGRTILVVTDPHLKQITSLETLEGKPLGKATPLDRIKNNFRRRHRASTPAPAVPIKQDPEFNAVDQAYDKYHGAISGIEE
jgi:putative transposase